MEKCFQKAANGIESSKLEDLVLDNAKSADGKVSGLPDDLENLESLSLINCSLTSLEGLPKLPKLKRLDVSDNPISTSLDIIAKQCPVLGALVLNNCQFADLTAFEALKGSTIETLDLDGNEVVNDETYRTELFKVIPTLKFLDGINQEGECLDDSDFDDEEGEDFGDSEGDEDGPGLSFFQNSELVDDEDETEDYDPATKKRRHESVDDDDESNDEPAAKQ